MFKNIAQIYPFFWNFKQKSFILWISTMPREFHKKKWEKF